MELALQRGCTLSTSKRGTIVQKNDSKLPKADGGKNAWLFLLGCFVIEALVWGQHPYANQKDYIANEPIGFPISFGVFETYCSNSLAFSRHSDEIAAIGTFALGGMYLIAPLTLYILEAWPSMRRISSVFGLLIVLTALVAASFSTRVWHLILTQGILYAVGGSFLYAPTMFYLDE
jgi:hypothetical protein